MRNWEVTLPFIQAGDIELYFQTAGEGTKLLFISGSSADLRIKPNMFDGPLAKNFELVSYDQRGLGQSDKPDWPYTIADFASDAVNFMDAGGWEKAHILGYSFGGMVAQELAIRYPNRVDKLVLCATSSGGEGGRSYPLHELEDMPVKHRIRIGTQISDTRCDEAWQGKNPDAMVEHARNAGAIRRLYGKEANFNIGREHLMEARRYHDCWDRLREITAETLVCGGRYDGIAPPTNQEALASQIPNARLEMFEGGHIFIAQDKSAHVKIIEFLLEEK